MRIKQTRNLIKVRSIDLKFLYDALLGDTSPCAKFQLNGFTGTGSFFTFVFPPAQDRDGGEVNIRDLKIHSDSLSEHA